MRMRRKFLALLFGAGAPVAAQMQQLHNPPRCPVCKSAAAEAPVNIQILGTDGSADGSSLAYPALVCPACGVIFCVQPAVVTYG